MDNPTKIKRILCAEDELKNPHSIFYTYKRLIQIENNMMYLVMGNIMLIYQKIIKTEFARF